MDLYPDDSQSAVAGERDLIRDVIEIAEDARTGLSVKYILPVLNRRMEGVLRGAHADRRLTAAVWPMFLQAIEGLDRTDGGDLRRQWQWLAVIAALRPSLERDLEVLDADLRQIGGTA